MDNNLNQSNNRTPQRPSSSQRSMSTQRPAQTSNIQQSPASPQHPVMPNMQQRPVSSQHLTQTPNKQQRPTTPITAEEKLRRGIRGLSYTGSGSSGIGGNVSNTKNDRELRKKVGGVVLDLDTIQDANNQKFETKGRRNNVIILVLSLLLVVSLVYLTIAVLGYMNKDKTPNCKYTVEGEASWIIEGETKTEFVIPQGLHSDMIYLIKSSIKIESSDVSSLTVEIKALLNGEEIFVSGLQEANENLIRIENTNKFVYQATIVGGETINLFNGIDFSDAPSELNSNNIMLEIIAYVQ